jgi:hypothetical protein
VQQFVELVDRRSCIVQFGQLRHRPWRPRSDRSRRCRSHRDEFLVLLDLRRFPEKSGSGDPASALPVRRSAMLRTAAVLSWLLVAGFALPDIPAIASVARGDGIRQTPCPRPSLHKRETTGALDQDSKSCVGMLTTSESDDSTAPMPPAGTPELKRVTSRGGSRCSSTGRPGSSIRRSTQCAA